MGVVPLTVRRENFGEQDIFSKGGRLKMILTNSLFLKRIDTCYLKPFQNKCQKQNLVAQV